MGSRFFFSILERNKISFTQIWGKEHTGRYWKRKLSKARRRCAKRLCKYGENDLGKVERGLREIESTCNWKNW